MNSTHYGSSSQPLRESDPEEYDLVILGGGTGSTLAARPGVLCFSLDFDIDVGIPDGTKWQRTSSR
jgi:hypothetical protein